MHCASNTHVPYCTTQEPVCRYVCSRDAAVGAANCSDLSNAELWHDAQDYAHTFQIMSGGPQGPLSRQGTVAHMAWLKSCKITHQDSVSTCDMPCATCNGYVEGEVCLVSPASMSGLGGGVRASEQAIKTAISGPGPERISTTNVCGSPPLSVLIQT